MTTTDKVEAQAAAIGDAIEQAFERWADRLMEELELRYPARPEPQGRTPRARLKDLGR